MDLVTLAFAFAAGVLSAANPCVLPVIPVVFATAASTHKLGPVALVAGLTLSFVAFCIFIATIGFSLGMDGSGLYAAAAVVLIAIGLVLMVPRLQAQVAIATSPVVNWAGQRLGALSAGGLTGQFGVGLLLGVVWTPCVGPTLGAASVLAVQGRDLGQVALTMVVFAIGATLPLVLLGLVSRQVFAKWRDSLLSVGNTAKIVFGAVLVASGLLMLTGLDKVLMARLLELMPEWLTNLTTRF